MSDAEFEMSVFAYIRNPDCNVNFDPDERWVAMRIGNQAHGDVLQAFFQDPKALFTLARTCWMPA